jgi:cell division protein FtsL
VRPAELVFAAVMISIAVVWIGHNVRELVLMVRVHRQERRVLRDHYAALNSLPKLHDISDENSN